MYVEYPTLYNDKTVRARKNHNCCECGRVILPGLHYRRVDGLWDGRFDTYKQCMDCYEVGQWYNSYLDGDEGYPFTQLYYYLAESLAGVYVREEINFDKCPAPSLVLEKCVRDEDQRAALMEDDDE